MSNVNESYKTNFCSSIKSKIMKMSQNLKYEIAILLEKYK